MRSPCESDAGEKIFKVTDTGEFITANMFNPLCYAVWRQSKECAMWLVRTFGLRLFMQTQRMLADINEGDLQVSNMLLATILLKPKTEILLFLLRQPDFVMEGDDMVSLLCGCV